MVFSAVCMQIRPIFFLIFMHPVKEDMPFHCRSFDMKDLCTHCNFLDLNIHVYIIKIKLSAH